MNRSLLNQKYEPLRKLAAGGMGEIFLARQTGIAGFQREVVLKVIHPKLSENARAVEMFLDEARLAASLNHPNIVQIFDVGEENGGYFIVMERIFGVSLRQLAENTTRLGRMIPLECAINIIMQALEGLRYAHTYHDDSGRPLRIVHRDICPSNLLVTYHGGIKLVDFGIARAENQLRHESGIRPGKFSYMSPEVLRGDVADSRSDLFSIGVVLYELTVGQRLFRASSYETMRRIIREPIAPPTYSRAGYPADLENVVMRALEFDPVDRFESAEAMLEQLEQFAFNTGLRISRLRLGRYLCRVMGQTGSALDFDALQETEVSMSEQQPEDLNFDRAGIFDEVYHRGEGKTRGVAKTIGPTDKMITELVHMSELAGEPYEDALDEGKTVEIAPGDNAHLVAQTVSQTGLTDVSAPAVSNPEEITAAAYLEDVQQEPVAPARGSSQKTHESSVVVVTDELVEEEIELADPFAEPWLDPEGVPRSRRAQRRRSTHERRAQDQVVTRRVPRDVLEIVDEARVEEAHMTQAAEVASSLHREEGSVPEASADLKEALAEISAELKAAEEADRRRVEALAEAIDLLGEDTISIPPAPEEQGIDKLLTSLHAPAASDLRPPPPMTSAEASGESSSGQRQLGDELEQADGAVERGPDALEMSDLANDSRRPPPFRPPGREQREHELEAEGETIFLREDDSAIEVEAPLTPEFACIDPAAQASLAGLPHLPEAAQAEEAMSSDGLDDKTIETPPRVFSTLPPAASQLPPQVISKLSPQTEGEAPIVRGIPATPAGRVSVRPTNSETPRARTRRRTAQVAPRRKKTSRTPSKRSTLRERKLLKGRSQKPHRRRR